jgi:hypothetical protein
MKTEIYRIEHFYIKDLLAAEIKQRRAGEIIIMGMFFKTCIDYAERYLGEIKGKRA